MRKSSSSWDPVAHFDRDSDRITIFAPLLRQLAAIKAHYELAGEKVAAITASCQKGELFEAGVMRDDKFYFVKLKISNDGIHEYGREEDL